MSRAEIFVAETMRIAAPYVAAGLAGVVTERAGIVNIALEGVLVTSGLSAACVAIATGSATLGVAAGIAAGAAFSTVHALAAVRARIDAIVSGVALNVLAVGLSRVVLRVLYDSASNSPKVPGFDAFSPREAIAHVIADPVFLAVAAAIPTVVFVLARTRFGLRLRACGEDPSSAAAAGVPVARVRIAASAFSGAICGLGGCHLVFDQHHFDSGMSGGRGFIALAAVILGGWRPIPVAIACLGFAALEATQIATQDVAKIPSEIVQAIPYVATLVLLAGVAGKARPPEGLGKDAA